MDWLTFFSKLGEHIAWPATTLVLVLIFKETIKVKVEGLISARAGGFEAEFDRGLVKIQDDLERQEPLLDPRAAILNAYEDVEEAAKSVNLVTTDTLKDAIEQLRILRNLVENTKTGHQPTTNSAFKYVALARQARASLETLTERERQILDLIMAEKKNREIAQDLGISIKTVEVHRANIMSKANVSDVAGLVKWYHETQKS